MLLRIEWVCYLVFRLRFIYLVYLRRCLRVHNDEAAVYGHQYSIAMLRKGRTSDRPLRLIRPLSVIDAVKLDGDVLSIGSRFETELLYLVGYGFLGKKIRGLDMISYSPWVDPGNMHAMPYPDNRWDVIILGWVIAYSADPGQVAREVVRVARPGAVIAIGLSYIPMTMLLDMKQQNAMIGEPETRIQTVAGLLGLFAGHVERVYHNHDAADSSQLGVCTVIFSIKK